MSSYLPEQLLEIAKKKGASAVEVYLSNTLSHPVYFESNRLKQLENISSEGVALRLWQNHQPGLAIAYGNVPPESLVEQALAVSELNEPEEIFLSATTATDYPSQYGHTIPTATAKEQLIKVGAEAIAVITDQYPDVICESSWSYDAETLRLVNSLGLDCGYTDITVDGYLSAELIRGDDFLNIWHGQSAREIFGSDRLTAKVLSHLHWCTHNTPAPMGKVPILFTPKAVETLLEVVVLAINGRQVKQQASPWQHKLDQLVISELLTLSQQPNFGASSLPFDDEGTPTQAFTWIERGVLKGFYGDRRTAHELQIPFYGNGFRHSLGSHPSPSLFNLIVSPGHGSFADLVAPMSDGLIVDQVLGEGAGLSGDFSVNVELGYRVKQGQIRGRVKDTMVTGNAYTALQNIMQLGADQEWQGSLYTPSMLVDGLVVTSRA